MNTKYTIDPQTILDAHAKTCEYCDDCGEIEDGCFCKEMEEEDDGPGLARRLIEAREERRMLEDAILKWCYGPVSGHFEAMNELDALAERIKKGREHAKANE